MVPKAAVDKRKPDPVVSTRYPATKKKLLEVVKERRGDEHLSDTVAHALDRMIEEHFPSALLAAS